MTTNPMSHINLSTLDKLRDSEIGWTVPWMLLKVRGKWVIKQSSPVVSESYGTATMKIKRKGNTIIVIRSTIEWEHVEINPQIPSDEIYLSARISLF